MRTTRCVLAVALLVALAPAGPGWLRSAAAATSLPSGFRLEAIPTGQAAYDLSSFGFVPGGGILTLGRSGLLTFVPADGPPRPVGRIPGVLVKGDVGAVGLAVSPDFATTGFVYVAYAYLREDVVIGRVSRWTVTTPGAPTGMADERIVLDDIVHGVPYHGLGTVLVAPDGALLVGMGDGATFKYADVRSLRTQDPEQPLGKILRVDPLTGAGLADNPFFDPTRPSSWRSRVYAMGFRNPFRFGVDPFSGRLVAGDVGWNRFEEIDVVLPGGNYGWPCLEGSYRPTGHATAPVCTQLYAQAHRAVPPIVSYPHNDIGSSVTGGAWYTGDSYPERYRNAYFYGDYARKVLWTQQFDAQGGIAVPPEAAGFGRDVGAPVDIRSGPNGDIHFADIAAGVVRRLRYAPGNRAPVAVIDTTVDADTRTVTFDGSRSYDLDEDRLTYAWQFGDGTGAVGRTASHVYASPGTYTATLTVTDALAATGAASVRVVPDNHAPKVVLSAPSQMVYAVGQPVELTATATDVEVGALAVTWQTLLYHCPGSGSCHVHPGASGSGPSYAQPFTDHGEDTRQEVVASAVDSAGVSAEVHYEAVPDLRTLTVLAPVPALINERQRVSARVSVGSVNVVSLPAVSGPLQFVSRSDGGAPEQAVTMPAADLAITGTYETAIDIRRRELGPGHFLGAASGPELGIGAGRVRPFAGGDMYWSAATGVHWVKGRIRSRLDATGGVRRFGFPTTDEQPSAEGRESRFQRATFYWSRATSAHFVKDAIRTKYVERGATNSVLRFPVSDKVGIAGGRVNRFQGGDIYWSKATGAHVINGAIRNRWLALRGHRGRLGFPRTDVLRTSYGYVSRFEGGAIRWLRATRTTKVIIR